MITISPLLNISENEIEMSAIRAQGSGGQNVNKVSSAIHLRFDIKNSSLPEAVQARLLSCRDKRLTDEGVFVLKAQLFRTQEKNRENAISRLIEWINDNNKVQKSRRTTRLRRAVKARRKVAKQAHSQRKQQRQKVNWR